MSGGGPDDDRDGEAVRGFMARWSRRKRAPETEPDPEDVAAAEAEAQAEAEAKERAEAADTRTDDEILRDLGLPDPDSLGPGDDFKRFMAPQVPTRFRTRALRKLWTSNPVLANLDGLNDYDGDYTGKTPGGLVEIGNVRTAYRVGRGLLKAVDDIIAEDTGDAPDRTATASVAPTDAAASAPSETDAPPPGREDPHQAGTAKALADPSDRADSATAGTSEPLGAAGSETSARPTRRMKFRPLPDPARNG